MSFYKERLLQYNNLYSIGVLPQIEGRYLSGPKINFKTTQPSITNHQQHKIFTEKFCLQKAKERISYELKLAQQQNRICQQYKSDQIVSIILKKESEEKKATVYEKRIRSLQIDNVFQASKSKSKRMHSLMNQRKILTLSKNKSAAAHNCKNLNILKILIRKKNQKSIAQNHIFRRSMDSSPEKNIKIKINKQPMQFYNFTTSRSFILTEDIDKQKISLKRPQIIRSNDIKRSHATERKQCFNNPKKQDLLDQTMSQTHKNEDQNQRLKKTSVDLIDDLDALSQEKEQQQYKERSNDHIERWK